MLPAAREENNGAENPGLTLERIYSYREDQLTWQQWRWESADSEDYEAGNQFSESDRQEMQSNGIPLITINRVHKQVKEVIGILRTNLTDIKLSAEDPQAEDATDALSVKVHEAERTSKLREAKFAASTDAARIGIGFIELGRDPNPFRPSIKAERAPWREMSWDFRNGVDPENWEYTRRSKAYNVDRLQAAFPKFSREIENSTWYTDNFRQWIDIDQHYREVNGRNWRDVPLSWNWSGDSQKRFRLLEEYFYQVQLEGVVVRLPSGRVVAYEDCHDNPMIRLAIKSGYAQMEEANYSRWRRSYWINDLCVEDTWSPLPFGMLPYIPIWCYREDSTGVPYGIVRMMRSIQDAINTMEAKMMFSINAKQVKFEEGAIDIPTWQQQVGRKNGFLPVRPGFMGKVEINDHSPLHAQHFELYMDLKNESQIVTGTGGLNPAGTGQKARSAVQAQQMMMQSMSALGEFQENVSSATIRSGLLLTEMVKEDIAKKGNVKTEVKDGGGRKKMITLHGHKEMYLHDDGEVHQIIDNDITMLNTNVALEEVPHTATYRAGQLDNLAIALQSLPPNDPQLTKVRLILTAKMLECSDIPGAVDDARIIREAIGINPPETPEEQQAAQAAARQAAQAQQLQVEDATAKIARTQAAANKDNAAAAHHQALAQTEAQPDPMEQAERGIALRKQAGQVGQIAAKTAHTEALTDLTRRKADGQAVENSTPQAPANW